MLWHFLCGLVLGLYTFLEPVSADWSTSVPWSHNYSCVYISDLKFGPLTPRELLFKISHARLTVELFK